MLHTALLDGLSTPVWITIGAAGAVAVAAVVYGACRNFVRMAWTAWQILAVFALSLLLRFIPLPEGWAGFAVIAAYLFGTTALVLLVGGAARNYMLRRKIPAGRFLRFCNRFLGAFTALLDFAVLALILGGFALNVIAYFVPLEALAPVYENPVWTEFGALYVQDLVLIAVAFFFVRGGYRIGVARSLQTVITLSLTAGSLLLAMYLSLNVPFLRGWAGSIANGIAGGGLSVTFAAIIGYLIITFVCFIVFFAVVMTLGFFLNKLVRKMRSVRGLRYIDGAILSVVFFAFFCALVCAWNYALFVFSTGDLGFLGEFGGEISQGVTEYAARLSLLGTSSPLGALFFFLNPLLLL